jgi:hypothetical protein
VVNERKKNPIMNEEGRLDVVCDGWRLQAWIVGDGVMPDGTACKGGLAVEIVRADGCEIERNSLNAPIDVGSVEIFSIVGDGNDS